VVSEYFTLLGNAATTCNKQVVNIGELESMIIEEWASDEERGSIATEDTPHVQ